MRAVAFVVMSLLLSACGMPTAIVLTAYTVDGASYVATGKTTSGHALSAATKKDCSLLYGLTRGKVCEEAPPAQTERAGVRVPDEAPPGKVMKPVFMDDASIAEIDDSFSNLETTTVSADLSTTTTPALNDGSAPRPHTPLWTLVLGTFDNETAARKLVKRLEPEKALITVTVIQGEVAYRVSTEAFKISEADDRRARVAHLEQNDVHISRVCPAWMRDERCVVLERSLPQQRALLK